MRKLKLTNGHVQGQIKTVLGREIVEFLSIPYCKPPVGELRFQKPQRCEYHSDDVINKLKFETCPPQLAQRIFNGLNVDEETWVPKETQDENSLYANIWCPVDILDSCENHPVFVWIYGGGFVSGSSSLDIYNGANLASKENIVVVSFNYRLAMLGFLCLDDELINGNLGIWDQVLALQWIHDNISTFKGNPDRITIGGNSAGGCSVSLHLLINESWKFFNQAIILSGVCFSDWGFLPKKELVRRSEQAVNKILDKFQYSLRWSHNLEKDNKKSIIRFLQSINHNEFLVDKEIVKGITQFAWAPCVDGELIKDYPRNLFAKEKFKHCPTVFLNVENEGSYFIIYKFPDIAVDDRDLVDMKYFDGSFEFYPHYPRICKDSVKIKIKANYNITEEKLSVKLLDKIISDQYFVTGSIELANCISQYNKDVYYLWFKTSFPNEYWPEWCGVMHSEELYYLFGHSLTPDSIYYESKDDFDQKIMKEFGFFIKNGRLPQEMPYFDHATKKIIAIDKNVWTTETLSKDRLENVAFWENLRKEHDLS